MAQVLPFEAVAAARPGAAPARPFLGDILVRSGALAAAALDEALEEQRQQESLLGHILLVRGNITSEALTSALAEQARLGRIDLRAEPCDPALVAAADPYRCLALEAVPWRRHGGRLVIALANPALGHDVLAAFGDDGAQLALAIAPAEAIRQTIAGQFGPAMVRDAEHRCPAAMSCRTLVANRFTRRKALALAALAAGIGAAPWLAFWAFLAWAMVAHAATTALRLAALLVRPRGATEPAPAGPRLADHRKRPCVSILVPLKGEAAIAGHLLAALRRMEYPAPLLDIKLVLEARDGATLAALERAGLPPTIEVITVPRGTIETKPRALNYALPFCRGEIVGVYDAEDLPDPGQIRAVVHHLMEAGPQVACVQGALDFYNTGRNLLSRWFTVDYAAWFRIMLPGVQRLGLPIPLGGTTVFFRRRVLEEIGGWDAHNVTEDADLGMRLARHGYRCEMIATTTEEEACSDGPARWVRQRSRWLKGYAITWGTHMRRPGRLLRELGPAGFLGFQLMFLGGITAYLAIPLWWTIAAAQLWGLPLADRLPPAFATGLMVTMLSGLVVEWLVAGVALVTTGRARMLGWIPTLPLYGLLGALAACRALAEILYAPFHWHKTEHGRVERPREHQP